MPAMADEVVVVGSGLAGIATALAAADGGARVTLLEARPRLGGATFSFQREGLELDNGQHVYLRCCRAYQSLLERLGVRELAPLQPRLDVPVLAPGGRMGRLRRGNLPAPLHLAGTLARYPYLTWSDGRGWSAPCWRCAGWTPPTSGSTSGASGPGSPARARAGRPPTRSGSWSACRPSTRAPTRPRSSSPPWCSRPAC